MYYPQGRGGNGKEERRFRIRTEVAVRYVFNVEFCRADRYLVYVDFVCPEKHKQGYGMDCGFPYLPLIWNPS